MKKVLVTGAAGAIGLQVIKYLLAEGKYEITAIDLKSKGVIQKLRRYKRRVNVLYGDISDRILIEALVKDHNIIIHLASTLPPLADMKRGLADIVDYQGTENIIRAISYYNPKCHLFYASTTSMYKDKVDPTVKSKIELQEYDYFSLAKYNTEKLIKEKLKNYTIYRIPLVLCNPLTEPFMFHVKKNSIIDVITKEDAAYSFVKGIKYIDKLNRKTFNVCGDEPILYKDLLKQILKIIGLSWNYVFNRLFIEKNYYSPVCADKDDLNNIINYRNDSITEYYKRLRSRVKNRKFAKFLAKPLINLKVEWSENNGKSI